MAAMVAGVYIYILPYLKAYSLFEYHKFVWSIEMVIRVNGEKIFLVTQQQMKMDGNKLFCMCVCVCVYAQKHKVKEQTEKKAKEEVGRGE